MKNTKRKIHAHPVLIIGAGRGGTALLEMFQGDDLVKVVAITDINPDAPGLKLAKKYGIPTYTDVAEALQACKVYPDCIIYNLTHDDSIVELVNQVFGNKRMASGHEVKLFWQMVMNQKQIKEELEKSQNQLKAIINTAIDGIIMINEHGEIQGFNPAAEKIFGYSREEVLGKNVKLLMPEPARGEHDGYINRYLKTGQARMIGRRGSELIASRKNGELFPLEISLSEMVLGGLRYFVGITRDITERKKAEQKIAHLAHYDFLTDLPNRAFFMSSFERSVSLAKRNNYKVAALFLDLDGFKKVNDTLGHEGGDLLLQEVAKRLRKAIRDSDSVARVGGDEFTFFLDNIGSAENAAMMASKIIAALSEPFELKGQSCHIGGSIGISVFPDDSENIEKLVRQADDAMYLAKQSGKNTCRFYRDVLHDPAKE